MMDNDSEVRQEFHPADYVIFLGVLVVSLVIGLYYAVTGGRQQTTKEFLMANHQMKTLPVALSILVSFVSGILVLGTPAEMYTRGTQLFMRTIGYCVACFLSSRLFVPLFFSLKVTSSFEVRSAFFPPQNPRDMENVKCGVRSEMGRIFVFPPFLPSGYDCNYSETESNKAGIRSVSKQGKLVSK